MSKRDVRNRARNIAVAALIANHNDEYKEHFRKAKLKVEDEQRELEAETEGWDTRP